MKMAQIGEGDGFDGEPGERFLACERVRRSRISAVALVKKHLELTLRPLTIVGDILDGERLELRPPLSYQVPSDGEESAARDCRLVAKDKGLEGAMRPGEKTVDRLG